VIDGPHYIHILTYLQCLLLLIGQCLLALDVCLFEEVWISLFLKDLILINQIRVHVLANLGIQLSEHGTILSQRNFFDELLNIKGLSSFFFFFITSKVRLDLLAFWLSSFGLLVRHKSGKLLFYSK